jgi:hypothetical protein
MTHPLSEPGNGREKGQEAESERAPAAIVIVAAVTEAVSAPPIPYVPAVDADHVPKCVIAVAPVVENVNEDEFVLAPDEAAFHEHA